MTPELANSGENIAMGLETYSPEEVMQAWKDSPGHNKTMLLGQNGGTTFQGLSVGCFHRLNLREGVDFQKNPVPTSETIWFVQNFSYEAH